MIGNLLQISGLISALVFPALAVRPLLSWFCRGRTTVIPAWLLSLPVGYSLLTVFLFLGNLIFGMPVCLWSGLGVLFLLFVAGVLLSGGGYAGKIKCFSFRGNSGVAGYKGIYTDRDPGMNPGRGDRGCNNAASSADMGWRFYALFVVLASLFGLVLLTALSRPVDGIPGQGGWGYKAKAIFHERAVNPESIADSGRPYLHGSYPPGYPIFMAWCHSMMGGLNDHLIKLLPVVMSVILASGLYHFFRREFGLDGWKALLPLIGFFGGQTYLFCMATMYAESILLLFSLLGICLIYHHLSLEKAEGSETEYFLGIFLLGASAWTKNEGFLLFVPACLALALFKTFEEGRHLRGSVYAFLISFGLFILPWQLYKHYMGIGVYDFELGAGISRNILETWNVEKEILKAFGSTMFMRPWIHCGVWYLFGLVLIWKRGSIFKSKERLFLFLLCVLFVSAVAGGYLFSVRRLDWHLRVLPRILILPAGIAWLLIAGNTRWRVDVPEK